MFSMSMDWNPKQAALRESLPKSDRFDETIRLCLELHGLVHSGNVTIQKRPTPLDELFDGLTKEAFSVMPSPKDTTIAWNIWHITRIEDITANILINDGKQVLNNTWLKKLKSSICDTGNAMTKNEIKNWSKFLNMEMLRRYRNEVGQRTQSILKNLTFPDLKQKMKLESVNRILAEGGVTSHKDSIWLLDFWGKKAVAGILLMPITCHQIIHLSGSMKLKQKILKQRNDDDIFRQ
jgi:hypothetical protein